MKARNSDSPRLQRRKRRRADEPPLAIRAPGGHAEGAAQAPSLDAPPHANAVAQRQEAVRELQAQRGNAHVQRLIARQAEGGAPAAAPEIWASEHGTFHVFPDDQPLSLGQVQDPQRERPLPRQVAEKIRPASELLKGGGAPVTLKGDAAFKAALLMDLAWVMEQPGGKELIDAVLKAGRALTFEYAPDGGEPEAASPTDAELRPDGALGPGSDALLRYGPEPWAPAGGVQAWEQRKPAAGLARALVATLPIVSGSAPSTREREPIVSGSASTGQDGLARLIEQENRARAAFGLPLRPSS